MMVKTKASVVQLLRDFAQLYTAYDDEPCTYERMKAFRWSRSLISRGLQDVQAGLADVKKLMDDIGNLTVMPSLVLTPAGSQIINTKLKKLTDLSAKLAIMRVTISKVLKRLQVRNCQMRSRGSMAHGQDIRFCCYNPPELLWAESLTFLQEANDTG